MIFTSWNFNVRIFSHVESTGNCSTPRKGDVCEGMTRFPGSQPSRWGNWMKLEVLIAASRIFYLWKWREFHGFMGWLSGLISFKSNLEDFTWFWECSSLPPMKHTPFCPKKTPKICAVSSLAPCMVAGAEATDGASAFQAVPRRFGTPGARRGRWSSIISHATDVYMVNWWIIYNILYI